MDPQTVLNTVAGYKSEVYNGSRNTILGALSRVVAGNNNVIIGSNCTVTGNNNLVLGDNLIVEGNGCFVTGAGRQVKRSDGEKMVYAKEVQTLLRTMLETLNPSPPIPPPHVLQPPRPAAPPPHEEPTVPPSDKTQ